MCVTHFKCILLENQVSSKITFVQFFFAAFLVVLGPFWLYEECYDRYPKSPCQSLKKTRVTIFIEAFIAAYDSTAQDLAAKIH